MRPQRRYFSIKLVLNAGLLIVGSLGLRLAATSSGGGVLTSSFGHSPSFRSRCSGTTLSIYSLFAPVVGIC